MTAVATSTPIRLQADCDFVSCADIPHQLYAKLNTPNYTLGVAVMRAPDSLAEWAAEHRTARKRAWKAERGGYRFSEVDMSEYAEDRHAVNTSLESRQGRPMSDGYRRPYQPTRLPFYPCDRHRIITYGVLLDERLVAYSTLYRAGELALVSMIIGHGAHLADGIMYLLAAGMIQAHPGAVFYYNRYDSGTDGLRFYKQRVGFEPADVEWVLG